MKRPPILISGLAIALGLYSLSFLYFSSVVVQQDGIKIDKITCDGQEEWETQLIQWGSTVRPLESVPSIAESLKKLQSWKLGWNGKFISYSFVGNSFQEIVDFATAVNRIAEDFKHHPEFRILNGRRVVLSTSSTTSGGWGLTSVDFALAAALEHTVIDMHNPDEFQQQQHVEDVSLRSGITPSVSSASAEEAVTEQDDYTATEQTTTSSASADLDTVSPAVEEAVTEQDDYTATEQTTTSSASAEEAVTEQDDYTATEQITTSSAADVDMVQDDYTAPEQEAPESAPPTGVDAIQDDAPAPQQEAPKSSPSTPSTEVVGTEPLWKTRVGRIRALDAKLLDPPTQPLIFIKQTKVGGSTLSGVFRQYADRNGIRACALPWEAGAVMTKELFKEHCIQDGVPPGLSSFQLTGAEGQNFYDFVLPDNWRFTVVRNPYERVKSAFKHALRKHEEWEREQHIGDWQFCARHAVKGKAQEWLRACSGFWQDKQLKTAMYGGRHSVQSVLNAYKFVAVSDRFDESLVVLRRLLGMSMLDILYISSKVSPRLDDVTGAELETPEFQAVVHAGSREDFDMWVEANRRLSLQIEEFGVDVIHTDLKIFLSLKESAGNECVAAHERGVYTERGNWALYRDEGNGWNCFKEWYVKNVNPAVPLANAGRTVDPYAKH